MVINETIILLTYYYDYDLEGYNYRFLERVNKWLGGAYIPFDLYLYKPLQEIFSKTIVYDYLKQMTQVGVKAVNEEIIALVRKEHPKYVLWTSWKYDVQESTLEMIRKEGSIVVGWFFDDEWRFDDYSKWWVPHLDYCATNAMEAVPKYMELGARVIHRIPNTGIPTNRDWSNIEEKYDVSFIGTRFLADREQWINELKNKNTPIHLFGRGWGRYVPFEEMIDIFKISKINLNFSKTYFPSAKLQIKGRMFQVCMAGGFLLTEYAPGIENYFELDKEIVCFENPEEMVDKVIYYLNHETERRAIAQAGWKRATGEHTCFHIVSKVFGEIEKDITVRGKRANLNPQKLKMPMEIRKLPSRYHFEWGRALLVENYKGLWKDALALSISYYPLNIRAWFCYIIGFLPFFTRSALIRLYKAMRKLRRALLSTLGSIPYLRKLKQSFTKRL